MKVLGKFGLGNFTDVAKDIYALCLNVEISCHLGMLIRVLEYFKIN